MLTGIGLSMRTREGKDGLFDMRPLFGTQPIQRAWFRRIATHNLSLETYVLLALVVPGLLYEATFEAGVVSLPTLLQQTTEKGKGASHVGSVR